MNNYNSQKCFIGGSHEQTDGCPSTGYHYADIGVPIEVKPKVNVGCITVECCGEPCVICKNNGGDCGYCIEITEKIKICVPVGFDVMTEVGTEFIKCDCDRKNEY